MNVDKFGLHMYKRKNGDNDFIFNYTSEGNLSARNKVLKHLQSPIDADDSATKSYVDKCFENLLHKLKLLEQLLNEFSIKIINLETSAKNEQSRRRK